MNDTQQVKDSFSSGLLTVIDTDSIYSENGVNYKSIVDSGIFRLKKLNKNAKRHLTNPACFKCGIFVTHEWYRT